MYNGIVNVYKETGWTSFDVVAKLRGIFGQKKIGHTGTLDPDAEGVLVVCLGNATKVSDMLMERGKTYRAVMLLGVDTDTQDISGKVLEVGDTSGITEDDVDEAVSGFVGEISQIPPMYSARKVGGRKLYEIARKGGSVEREPTLVSVFDIHIDEIRMPRVTMTVQCSKGTYIRTLCHDIGEELGCLGTMEHLIRLESAGFRAEDALRISEIQSMRDEGMLAKCVHPVEELFSEYPAVRTKVDADRLLHNGNRISPGQTDGDAPNAPMVRMLDSSGTFCGIYSFDDTDHGFRPVKMFLPEE